MFHLQNITKYQFSYKKILIIYMKVFSNFGSSNNIQKAYNELVQVCLSPKIPIRKVKNKYSITQDLFVKNGQVQDFYDKTLELSNHIENQGNKSISKLLINELCKLSMNFKLKENPENLLHKAIRNYKDNNDGFHELARIIDLEELYQQGFSRKDVFRVLRMKKDCCKRILANYDENVKNFASIKRAPTSRESVQAQLAYTYARIGDMLARKNPVDAIRAFEKSQNLNLELGRIRAADYAARTIADIKEYLRRKYW